MTPLSDLQQDLPPERVRELLASEEGIELIDVRDTYEHEAGHIAGASHVEIPALTQAAQDLDRERPIVFYCRSGQRSAMATQAFRASGFDAYNMEGGLLAWDAKGLPIEPAGGTVADH